MRTAYHIDPSDRLNGAGPLSISRICVGAVDDPATVAEAFSLGVNFFFFSCDLHWDFYEGVRQGLRDLFRIDPQARKQCVVALTSYMTQPEFLRPAFEEGLDALQGVTDYADVLIAGGVYAQDLTVRAAVLRDLLDSQYLGVRAIGATFHDRVAARVAAAGRLFDLIFVRYNVLHSGAARDFFPCLSPGSPPIFNFTNTWGYVEPDQLETLGLSTEHWVPRVTDHYRYVLARREIDGLLCAPMTPAELRGMVDVVSREPELSPEEIDYMARLARLGISAAAAARRR